MSESQERENHISVRCSDDLRGRGEVAASARGEGFSEMVRNIVEEEAERLGITSEVAEMVQDGGMTVPEALNAAKSDQIEEATAEN